MRIPHGKTVAVAVAIAEIGLAVGTARWPNNELLEVIFWLCSFTLLVIVVLWMIDGVRFIRRTYRFVSPIQRRIEQSPAIVAIPPQAEIKTETKRKYPAKEREERYDAWSRIYKVLNNECSVALDKLSYVSNTWRESILTSPKTYAESLFEAQKLVSLSLAEVNKIFTQYEYLTDIKGYFEGGWGPAMHPMKEAATVLRETLKRFPEDPHRQMVELLDPQAQALRQGVKGFGKWLSEAKKHTALKIKDLSS